MTQSDDFVAEVIEMGPLDPFKPMALYNADGDCIEVHLSNEPYYARRLDGWVTAYFSEQTDEVVGAVVKGVMSLLDRFPFVRIFVEGSEANIAFLLAGPLSATSDEVVQRTYKAIMDRATELQIRAELMPA